MKKSAPTNIGLGNLIKYRFPVMAIASILHRISGFLLFLYIPFMLWVLSCTLKSEQSFQQLQACLHKPVTQFFVWILLSAAAYHLIAGIKHLFMDIGHFETKTSGKIASSIVILLGVIAVVLLGVWLWV